MALRHLPKYLDTYDRYKLYHASCRSLRRDNPLSFLSKDSKEKILLGCNKLISANYPRT